MTKNIKYHSYSKKPFKLLSFKNLVVTGLVAWGGYYATNKYYQYTEQRTLADVMTKKATDYAQEKKQDATNAIKKSFNENEVVISVKEKLDNLSKLNPLSNSSNDSNSKSANSTSPASPIGSQDKPQDKKEVSLSVGVGIDIGVDVGVSSNPEAQPVNVTANNLPISIVIPVYYDHSGAPKGISQDQALQIISDSSKAWEKACGVKFNFVKMVATDHIGYKNLMKLEQGIIRWEYVQENAVGLALSQNTREIHRPNENYNYKHFAIALDPDTLTTAARMKSTLIHEMGHIIGLEHSRFPHSVMAASSVLDSQPPVLAGDAQACQGIVENAQKKLKI